VLQVNDQKDNKNTAIKKGDKKLKAQAIVPKGKPK
jgi:hypothetical protein